METRITLIYIALFIAAVSGHAYDRVYLEPVEIQAGQTGRLAVSLESQRDFYGFQGEIQLPAGLEFSGMAQGDGVLLSSRVPQDYVLNTNIVSSGILRIAGFSSLHTPILKGNGAVFYADIRASESFEGGTIELKDFLFTTGSGFDAKMPDSSLDLSSGSSGSLTIPDFDIAVGETKRITLQLDASPGTTAFQTDLHLPDGLVLDASSFQLCEGLGQTHALYTKAYSNGNIRIISMSPSNKEFPAGSRNNILSFDVTAVKDEVGEFVIRLTNTILSTAGGQDCKLSDSVCKVTVGRVLVESLWGVGEIYPTVRIGEPMQLEVEVVPYYAYNKEIRWESYHPELASVSQSGVVTAHAPGTAYIFARTTDGSDKCEIFFVTIPDIPIEGVAFAQRYIELPVNTSIRPELVFTPANTTQKNVSFFSASGNTSLKWDDTGLISAGEYLGETTLMVRSNANTDIKGYCTIKVIPDVYVERIELETREKTLKVGEKYYLNPTVYPENAYQKSLVIYSRDPEIADFSGFSEGWITAMKVGTAEIVIATIDGSQLVETMAVTVEGPDPEGIEIINGNPLELKVSQTVHLSAKVIPEDAADKSVSWGSSDDGVAVVDAEGHLTAVGLGICEITATTISGQTDSITVSVIPTLAEAISLTPEQVTLRAGGTAELAATVGPDATTDKRVGWSSSNPAVVIVGEDGIIRAVAVGEATVTASTLDGSAIEAHCLVRVVPTPVESITISQSEARVRIGETLRLSAEVYPDDATDKSVHWLSMNPSVASVDGCGMVTGRSLGETEIKAVASDGSGVEAACFVAVDRTLAEAISLNRSTAALKVGDTMQLNVEFEPVTTTERRVIWESSDSGVATVDELGIITAIALGECDVTAHTVDCSELSASCHVTVGETSAESVAISPHGPFTLNIGETVRLFAEVYPGTATDKTVSWMSQSGAVIVDENGLCTAMAMVEDNWVMATNSAGQTDIVYFTVLPREVADITLNVGELELRLGETAQLHAEVFPSDASFPEVTWESLNPGIAAVDGNGNVTALSVGVAIIRATSGGKTAEMTLTVTPVLAEELMVNSSKVNMEVGEERKLDAWVLPSDTTDPRLQWKIEDSTIAAVDENGLLTALAVGETVVTVRTTDGSNLSSTVAVCVKPTEVTEIIINYDGPTTVRVGDEFQLTATVLPENATDKSIIWSTQSPTTFDIDQTGHVRALAPHEKCWLGADAPNGVIAWLYFTVEPAQVPIESIKITAHGSTAPMYKGETLQLEAVITPEDATDRAMIWESSAPEIATVDQNGLVTIVSEPGVAWITCHNASNPDIEGYISLQVFETEARSLALSAASDRVFDGETLTVYADVMPATIKHKTVTWSVSDADILEIADTDGWACTVKGKKPGSAYVMAETANGVTAAFLVTVDPVLVQAIEIPDSLTLEVGEGYTFHPIVSPENASMKNVFWTSSNPQVGTVSAGTNTFRANGQGETLLTCSASDESGVAESCVVRVIKRVTGVSLNEHQLNLYEGDEFQLVAAVEPVDATDKHVVWTSSNPDAVEVDDYGLIEAKTEGETEITARSLSNPEVCDICHVNVSFDAGVETITLNGFKVEVDGLKVSVNDSRTRLYDMNGHLIPGKQPDPEQAEFIAPSPGCYILSIGSYSLKLLLTL